MSGHSKWATTKHKKAVVDAKRSKLFAKLIKNIEVAARTGGGDLAGNPTLFDAVQKAKKNSVPIDNIKGKAMFIWFSYPEKIFDVGSYRWPRIGNFVE